MQNLYLKNNIYKKLILDFLFSEYNLAIHDIRNKQHDNKIETIDINTESSTIFTYLLVYNLFSLETLKNIDNELNSYYKNKQNILIIRLKQLESKIMFFSDPILLNKIKKSILSNLSDHYINYISLDNKIDKIIIKKWKKIYLNELKNLLSDPKTSYLFILLMITYFINNKTIYKIINRK